MSHKLVPIPEAVGYLRCHRTMLRRLVRRGEFGYYRLGSRTLYEQGELDAYLDRQWVEPRAFNGDAPQAQPTSRRSGRGFTNRGARCT